MNEIDPTRIDRIAARYGITIEDTAHRRRLRETIRRIADRTDHPSVAPPADPPPDLRPGGDPYNAFRSRFTLDGAANGMLQDTSVAVKENIGVAGVETTCGSAGFTYTPATSAAVVGRLREAGATIVGTTNMDEFGYTPTGEFCAHGPVDNPNATAHIPGGSSSGSAAAVAGGLVDAALGTDTAGSVRTPAACCGVVGYKPTRDRVPRSGVLDLAPSLDHVGTLGEDVATAAWTAMAVCDSGGVSAPPARLEKDPGGLRVGLLEPALDRATDRVTAAVEAVSDALTASGVTVESKTGVALDRAVKATQTIIGAEFAALVANGGTLYGTETGVPPRLQTALRATASEGGFGVHVQRQLLYNGVLNEYFGGRRYAGAQATRRSVTEAVRSQFQAVDALLLPTLPVRAPPVESDTDMAAVRRLLSTTVPFNLAGTPAVSVPWPAADRPIGIQIVADRHADATACQLAQTIESNASD